MSSPASKRICIVPQLSGVGGMVSFQHKLAAGLTARGIEVVGDLADTPYAAVLVIGGTRQVAGLWQARRSGARIVQRLNGMNWLHRRRNTGLRHFLRAEYGNRLLAFIRGRLAHAIAYQSEFSRGWWERVHGPTPVESTVIHNGVDLHLYHPAGLHDRPEDCCRVLLVEASLMGGYEMGLETVVEMAQRLVPRLPAGTPVEVMVAGRVSPAASNHWEKQVRHLDLPVTIIWAGLVARERIPELDRSAHLLYSADIHAACPNSVIEALACGLPVVAYDTGALRELVTPEAGGIAPYGGDAWQLDPPDVNALVDAALAVYSRQEYYRSGARARAEAAFGLDRMVDHYLKILLPNG